MYNKKQTVIHQVPKAIKGNAAIPDGVEEIGSEVFYNRIGLTGIIIPNSVTNTSQFENAFWDKFWDKAVTSYFFPL